MITKFIILVVAIEISLQILVQKTKKIFQWFLMPEDIFPEFNKNKYNNYIRNSFSKKFGWVRKSKLIGFDRLNNKKIKFSINKDGYRKNINSKKKKLYASFGGSYVFGRQVKDFQTWQEQISKKSNFNILNYGIGNYGTDQAILRYKYTKFSKDTRYVILGIVPEHICRIQSEWKHFFEFGNIHGFKPKFYLKDNKLLLKKNPLDKNTKIKNIYKIIQRCKKTDRFYEEKFKKNIFKFPYLLTFARNFKFNLKIIFLYLFYKNNKNINDFFLKEIMKRNIKEAHNYYNDYYSIKLFKSLIKYYVNIAKKKNHIPYLIILPQLMDIKFRKTNRYYVNFFKNEISKELKVLDLTKFFERKKIDKLFTNRHYGGHLTPSGNNYVANIINRFLKENV